MTSHMHAGYTFTTWNDVRLRIYDVTGKDSGVYRFQLTDVEGKTEQHLIYVDVKNVRRKRRRKNLIGAE